MQQPVLELPPIHITDHFLTVTLPELYPFGLPKWPNNEIYFPQLPTNTDSPAENISNQPSALETISSIAEEIRKSYFKEIPAFASEFKASIEKEIETTPQTTADLPSHRQQVIDEIAFRKIVNLPILEKKAAQLLGYSPLNNTLAHNLKIYENLYGAIDPANSVFQENLRNSYIAAWERSIAALELFYFSMTLEGTTEELLDRVTTRRAEAAAKAEADRIAAEAAAKAEAERTAAEAAAKAEAERTAAEAAARTANTYSASSATMVGGSALITAAGSVVSNTANFALRATIAGAIGALAGLAQAVAAGFVVGVTALLYSPRLGNGELPKRFALHTPLSDLSPQLASDLQTAANVAVTADLPFRISSRTSDQG